MAVISASPAVISSPVPALRRRVTRAADVMSTEKQSAVALRLTMAVVALFLVALAASAVLMRPAVPAQAVPLRLASPAVAESVAYPAWTVQPGDTLWSVAAATQPDVDPRAVVLQLRVVNDLPPSHVLQVGEVLQVPGS